MEYHLGIVVADFNADMTYEMLSLVQKEAEYEGNILEVVHVAGVYDMPLAVQTLLKKSRIDGVLTLGVVLQGGTNHDVIVAENAAQKFVDLACQFEKPVTLGVIGPRVTREFALQRVEEYALHAYHALIQLLQELAKIK